MFLSSYGDVNRQFLLKNNNLFAFNGLYYTLRVIKSHVMFLESNLIHERDNCEDKFSHIFIQMANYFVCNDWHCGYVQSWLVGCAWPFLQARRQSWLQPWFGWRPNDASAIGLPDAKILWFHAALGTG